MVAEQTLVDWTPAPIQSIEDTRLSAIFVEDLALKFLYNRGELTGHEIASLMHLPFQTVVSPVMDSLKREQMCEVKGSGGLGSASYRYSITGKGITRAREQMERTTYTGPAPVSWDDYVQAVNAQGGKQLQVNPTIMKQALSHLVLEESVFSKIGPAVNSGKSIFLYGPPGNGKTTIAESIGRMILKNDIYIPYAVEVDGQIIKVYDEINHVIVPQEDSIGRGVTGSLGARRPDARWVRIKRPVIMVGGELTLDGLELVYDPNNKYYEAPFQMKANGGMFLIDDFGRQQIRPRDLLNRWIVPMEKNIDFLALHTGRKVEVPFEVLIVFSTNLPPRDLVDEAFLRRIRHKIEVTSPSFDGYRDIFKVMCNLRGVQYDEQAVRYLLQEYYVKANRKLRANHPRDLLDQMKDIAQYFGVELKLSKEMIDRAADAYFVDLY
ncbi:MAG: ATP-binding protein [Ardenticatenaceae bacterium]|nr:ATP-binding protein [Ardenticatenaceae bacterium]MCB9442687.1 ATP-binding protein [Ardenticatenaceae bacterium]